MSDDDGVHLRAVDPENVREVCRLQMGPGEERFVAPVAISLAQAYTQPESAWPRAIYDGDRLVGFVMADFDETEGEHWLWRLNIAAGAKRNGYGRFAVGQVAAEARRRGATRLLTSYVPDHGHPGGFYERLGFTPTGEIDEGEVVLALDLSDAAAG